MQKIIDSDSCFKDASRSKGSFLSIDKNHMED